MGCGHPGQESAFNARSIEPIAGEGKRLGFRRVKERLGARGAWLAIAPAVQLPLPWGDFLSRNRWRRTIGIRDLPVEPADLIKSERESPGEQEKRKEPHREDADIGHLAPPRGHVDKYACPDDRRDPQPNKDPGVFVGSHAEPEPQGHREQKGQESRQQNQQITLTEHKHFLPKQ